MTAREIRQKFLDFFIAEDHLLLPSFSLVPENDPTLLLVNSGMAPLKPYFLGLKEPPSKRLVDIQKCIRMEDVEKVGVSAGTQTFFEMMGNWSIGDYGKKEALEFAWKLLVKGFGFDPAKLWATVFNGDGVLPPDNEAIEIWKKLGIPEERILKLGMDDNFWVSGSTGPCGPCSEVFYDLGEQKGPTMKGDTYNRERLFEIWNACVFMQYNRDEKGNYHDLPFYSIDAGAGLERFSMIIQKKDTVFETDLSWSIIETIEKVFGKDYSDPDNQKVMRIIADHVRAAIFLIVDGVTPSNKTQGYILRRLLRRAVVKARALNKQFIEPNLEAVAESVLNIYNRIYFNRDECRNMVLSEIGEEIKRFTQTLEKGLREVEKISKIDGKLAFNLYQTYGFPLEITEELFSEKGQRIDHQEFEDEFRKHQELSRAASAGMFKGGLADQSEIVTKYHTATHLLQAVLRQVLSSEVHQKGSNLTSERLRFDFSHPKKLTSEQLSKVEKIVNEQIGKNLAVNMEIMDFEKAVQSGALTVPGEKYPEKVKVYTIGVFSKEVCGGPHVDFTRKLGRLKIIKEESAGAGVRRIYAVLEK